MKQLTLCLIFVVLILTACGPSPEEIAAQTATAQTAVAAAWTETPTITASPTATQTNTPEPTATNTPTITTTPTMTPIGGFPQVYIGITEQDVQLGACGSGLTIWTMNYGDQGEEIDFWDNYPDYEKPQISGTQVLYGTRDWRGNMDVCIYPGRPIIAQHHGIIKENRTYLFTPEDQECIITIDLAPDGMQGLELVLAHFNPDVDPETDGIQALESGTIISPGDIIGYTHQYVHNGEIRNPVFNIGLFNAKSNKKTNFGYWADQDLILIGLDGQINLIKP